MLSPHPDKITLVFTEEFIRKLCSHKKLRYKYKEEIKEMWARLNAEKKGESIE